MENINNNPFFITTDPTLRPSERLAQILFTILEKENYKYLKSKKEFVQEFEYGKRIIRMSFNSSFGYICRVSFNLTIIFTELEKQFKKVLPDFGWTNWTILSHDFRTSNWLCDEETGQYSDETLNKSAIDFFENIKPQIDNLKIKFKDYLSLNSEYNERPITYFDYLPRYDKRIINGLILIKSLDINQYESYKKEYLTFFEENYQNYDKDDIRKDIILGIENLDKIFIPILQ